MDESTSRSGEKNLLLAFGINLLFTVIEIVGAFFTNSIAILADAVHDLGDSLALGLAVIFERIANKKPDERYTFGYDRFRLLGALITSLILFGGTVFILSETIPRLFSPEAVHAEGMLGFAVLGIVFNGIAFFRVHGGDGLNEKAVALHLLEDLLGWVAILIGSIVLLFVDVPILDPLLSIGVSVFILIQVYQNTKEIFAILLQQAPKHHDIEELKQLVETVPGVLRCFHVHVWTQTSGKDMMSLHIMVDDTLDVPAIIDIKDQVRALLHEQDIEHVTIECNLPK
jgi:cobalt-zinc-cadmium efflux system protein